MAKIKTITLDQVMKEIDNLRDEVSTFTSRLYLAEQQVSALRERVEELEGDDSGKPYHL